MNKQTHLTILVLITFGYLNATTINIPGDYSTIQQGINVSTDGDTVLVQPGAYIGNINFNGKNILVASYFIISQDTNLIEQTLILGTGSECVVKFTNEETNDAKLIGFTISGGSGYDDKGGGIYCYQSDPTLQNLIVSQNRIEYFSGSYKGGGGIYLEYSAAIIRNVTVKENTVIDNSGGYTCVGGGIFLSSSGNAILENLIIQGNSVISGDNGYGGGVYIQNSNNATLTNCVIIENIVNVFGANKYSRGGGVYLSNSNYSNLENLTIQGNSVISVDYGHGGGIYLGSNTTLENLTIQGNNIIAANGYGGGIYLSGDNITLDSLIIIENTITCDYSNGAGLYLSNTSATVNTSQITGNYGINSTKGDGILISGGTLSLTNVTISDNYEDSNGVGIYNWGATVSINNSIIWDNNIELQNNTSNLTVLYCDIEGGQNGIINENGAYINWLGDNLDNDPLFEDAANGNYNLRENSPCIDTGSPYTPYDPDNTITDMGAYYYNQALPNAGFTSDLMIGNPPLTVQFTDTSHSGSFEASLISWNWNFGDSNTSIEQNPAHTFQTSGIYTIILTITDSLGFSDTEIKENYINVTATEIHNVDIGGDEDIQHLITHTPLINFDYYNSDDQSQTHYHIQVSTDSTFATIDMWDSGEVTSSDTSVTYAGNTFEDGQTYFLRAKIAAGDFWSDWSTLTFRMNSIPTSPIPLSPINDEIVLQSNPTLWISNSTDTELDTLTYEFQLSIDSFFTTLLDSAFFVPNGIDSTSWTSTSVLEDNQQIWWRAKTNDGFESSAFSNVASFILNAENDAPGTFALLLPTDSIDVITLIPLLDWETAFDPDPLDTVTYTLYCGDVIPDLLPVYVDTATSFQISTPLDDNTTYYWKVIATDLSGATTENSGGYWSFRVNTENDLPGDFALLSPEDGSMVTDLTPTFHWEEPTDADDGRSLSGTKDLFSEAKNTRTSSRSISSYNVYVSTDIMFSGIIPDTVLTNSYTHASDLNEDMVYYWKVEAVDDDGGVTSSAMWSFWTNNSNSTPDEFTLLTPEDDDELTTLTPIFTWNTTTDSDIGDQISYNLELGESVDSLSSVYTGTDTTFTSAVLSDNTTYYWKVIATDLSGATTENTGGYHSFRVNTENDPPSVFSLVTPTDNSIEVDLSPLFYWTEAVDPDPLDMVSYHLFIDQDQTFASTVAIEIDSNGFNYDILNTILDDNSSYYWKVNALDNHDAVTGSDTLQFWTDAFPEPPLAFNTISPVDSTEALPTEVSFVWNNTEDPDPIDNVSFTLVYATDWADSNTFEYVQSDGDTTASATLINDTEYFWWVMANDEDELSTQSNNGAINRIVVGTLAIDPTDLIPNVFALHQNYPNPFNPVTTLRYDLPEDAKVSIMIYDLMGREVKSLVNVQQNAGFKSIIWDATNDLGQPVSAGVYLYRISAGDFHKVKKMILLK